MQRYPITVSVFYLLGDIEKAEDNILNKYSGIDILESTMAAYSSVISNNLNNVMKVLTSITFIVSVPTLIGSLFGMNLDGIPGYSGTGKFPFAFLIVSLISIVCAVVCAIIMKKKKLL